MTAEQKIAYITCQATCAMLEAMGMQAENQGRSHQGLALAYNDDAFFGVAEKHGITSNQIVEFFKE